MIQDIAPHKYYVDYHPSTPNDTDLVFIYGHHTILCNFEDPRDPLSFDCRNCTCFPGNPGKSKISVPYRRNQLL